MPRHANWLLLFLLISLLGSHEAEAQLGKAVSRMQEEKWSSAEQILTKTLAKDSLDLEARLLYSQFFFYPNNPDRNLDSASSQAKRCMTIFGILPEKQIERLGREGIDSMSIVRLKTEIDSAAFEDAKKLNTVTAYEGFMVRFSDAKEVDIARELRNEVAFLEALRVNTAGSFSAYLEKYPDSRRTSEVLERYERLVFEETTRDGKVDSYKKFVAANPQSRHCSEAEQKIFEVSTASGLTDSYRQFLSEYSLSAYAVTARNILYYLLDEASRSRLESDSLARLGKLNSGYWVPFFKNGRYGFMNEEGQETIAPRFAEIDSSYRCGNIREDVLLTSEGLFSRAGHRLLASTPETVSSLGLGFLLVKSGECKTVVHKSGFTIGADCATDARIISEQFVAVRDARTWKLYALNGLQLSSQEFEDVAFEENIIILTRLGKKLLLKTDDLAAAADGAKINESLVFDEERAWGDGNLVVRNGALEGVLNQQLEFVIPLDRQTLTKTTSGFIRTKDGQKRIVGASHELEERAFDDIIDYGNWMVLEHTGKSVLYRTSTKAVAGRDLDSVWMKSKVPFAFRHDSLLVFGLSGRPAAFERKAPLTFIKSKDTLVYYWVQDKKLKAVFDAGNGKKLFTMDFEDIDGIGDGRFIVKQNVKQKNKKGPGAIKLGLISSDGKAILPSEYDAIIATSSRYLSLLSDKHFGLYDISRRLLIKTEYERNILPYSNKYFIAFKGAYGIINDKEEPVTDFEFDEIKYWNDTSALVRKNFTWSVYSIKSKSIKLTRIRNFHYLRDTNEEKIVRVQQDNHFGIVSSVHGVIIPATFSEVINVGSDEKPFYFTDKRVEEAEIDVVIYYDHRGKLIRKQVYESDEYDKIYCEEN